MKLRAAHIPELPAAILAKAQAEARYLHLRKKLNTQPAAPTTEGPLVLPVELLWDVSQRLSAITSQLRSLTLVSGRDANQVHTQDATSKDTRFTKALPVTGALTRGAPQPHTRFVPPSRYAIGTGRIPERPVHPTALAKAAAEYTDLIKSTGAGGGHTPPRASWATHTPAHKYAPSDTSIQRGDWVQVQRPNHDYPIWGTVVIRGRDGLKVKDSKGETHKVRWEDVHDHRPLVDREETAEGNLALARMQAPLAASPIKPDEVLQVDEALTEMGAPHNSQLVTGEHEAERSGAYDALHSLDAPVDHTDAARLHSDKHEPLGPEFDQLLNELAGVLPIDPARIKRLPREQALGVLAKFAAEHRTLGDKARPLGSSGR